MSRRIIIIRHAKAEGGRHDRHLFPKEGAPLIEDGREAASLLTRKLLALGVDPAHQPVAVSELIRTHQTAEAAGFKTIKVYSVLNEVNSDLTPAKLDALIGERIVPKQALSAAKRLLKSPPAENVWITHGMLIAGLAEELGMAKNTLYIPEMASAIEIIIPDN